MRNFSIAGLVTALALGVASASPLRAVADDRGAAAADGDDGRLLPFMADEARARGYELPLPFGAALVITRLGGRDITVEDVRISLDGSPQSVSDFVDLGSTSDVFNANLKFDAWLLPFLNVYALVGYVHNESDTHALITLPSPGPAPGDVQIERNVTTELDGMVGGIGLTLAAGYQDFFMVADASYIKSDLGFDDNFDAVIATIRSGWNGRFGDLPLQLWLGAGNWDTAATAKGHVDLDDGTRLTFEADQRPEQYWMYDIGTQLELSKRWQLVLDLGTDFEGGYFAVVAPTFRY